MTLTFDPKKIVIYALTMVGAGWLLTVAYYYAVGLFALWSMAHHGGM